MGGSKTTQTSNANQTATTTLPAWMTAAGQQNYNNAAAYVASPDATWSADKAAQYSNPYTQQVQANTLATMRQQDAMDQSSLADQAQAAKGYGGTRFAVEAAQQQKDQNTALTNYTDSSNAAAYTDAENQFNQQQARKLAGYQLLTSTLAATPRDTTTTGTSSGTNTTQQSAGFLNSLLALGGLGASIYGAR